MALLWIEGFEGMGTTLTGPPSPVGILGRKYPSVFDESTMNIVAGRSGYALQIDTSIAYMFSPNLTTDATMIFGCAIKMVTLPATSHESTLVSLVDGSNIGINLRVQPDGTIDVYKLNTLVGSTVLAMSQNTWYYLELKVLVAASATGTIDLVMNEATWFQVSSMVTQVTPNAWHSGFRLGDVDAVAHYDDIYVLDGTGSINNDILGPRKVVAIHPDAAGDDTDWTPDAGDNYDRVNEVELDEDTTYVETDTPGDQDLYNYGPTVNLSEITGIQIVVDAKVTTGSMELQTVTKSGTTEDTDSHGTIVSTSYGSHSTIEELNPDTSLPWTPGEIDAAQFGVKAV